MWTVCIVGELEQRIKSMVCETTKADSSLRVTWFARCLPLGKNSLENEQGEVEQESSVPYLHLPTVRSHGIH